MDTSLDDLRLLWVALSEGSLSGAARRLGIAQATVSRRVAALEAQVGHPLVIRSRGGLSLTAAGERLRPHLQGLQQASGRVLAALESMDEQPVGQVRLAVPPGVAVDMLIPLLPQLQARYPDVSLSVIASANVADLDADEADMALRFVRPTSGDLTTRLLGCAQWSVQAAPALAASLPTHPSLDQLPWITWPKTPSFAARRWLEANAPDAFIALESDDFLVQRAAAFAGVGVVLHGQTPGLVSLQLPGVDLPTANVFLVVRRSLVQVPRVKVVADLLVDKARQILATQVRA